MVLHKTIPSPPSEKKLLGAIRPRETQQQQYLDITRNTPLLILAPRMIEDDNYIEIRTCSFP
jgi:hypothetical protein